MHGRIIAYIIPKPNLPTLQESEIRSFLAEKLPSYMIPSLFVILSALPLTANGKIDRRALPNPQWQPSTSIAPRTPIEQKLATIWSQVLVVESVGTADNFFSLGGLNSCHSSSCQGKSAGFGTAIAADVPISNGGRISRSC